MFKHVHSSEPRYIHVHLYKLYDTYRISTFFFSNDFEFYNRNFVKSNFNLIFFTLIRNINITILNAKNRDGVKGNDNMTLSVHTQQM